MMVFDCGLRLYGLEQNSLEYVHNIMLIQNDSFHNRTRRYWLIYEEWLPSYTYSPKCIGYQGMSEGKTKWVTILEFQTAVSLSTLSLYASLSLSAVYLFLQYSLLHVLHHAPL